MSIQIDDIDHEVVVRAELKEIKEQLQVMNMILREAFNIDIVKNDIEDEQ